jgi:hypothetical protein
VSFFIGSALKGWFSSLTLYLSSMDTFYAEGLTGQWCVAHACLRLLDGANVRPEGSPMPIGTFNVDRTVIACGIATMAFLHRKSQRRAPGCKRTGSRLELTLLGSLIAQNPRSACGWPKWQIE